MPDIKLHTFPSSEAAILQEGDPQTLCSSRRRSCALVNTPTPCVNKAVCHILQLKTRLETWGRQGDDAQHESAHENSQSIVWKCEDENAVNTDLSIEGMGLCEQDSQSLWTESAGVLTEVMSLVERLELDRREAEKAIQEQKEKAEKLLKKLDSLSLWKQNEFPAEMKKEREACSADIAELTWQLKMRRDQQPQVSAGLTCAQGLNRRLTEDIDFRRKHGPLLLQRLQLEREIMKQIHTAQTQANETFSDLSQKLTNLEKELKEEELRVEHKKEHLNKEMETMRNHLSDKLTEFQQLQSQCEAFHTKIRETEEILPLRDSQIKTLLKELRQLEKQEAAANDEVGTLTAEVAVKEEILTSKKTQLQNQLEASKLEGDEKLSALDAILSQKRRDLSALRDKNKELQFEIEDFKRKIYKSKQTVKKLVVDHKNVMLKVSASEKEWKPVRDEFQQVSSKHSDTKAELDRLAQQTFLEELKNRKERDKLKTLIANEQATLDTLKDNMDAETEEYEQEQRDCENMKAELQNKYEDACSRGADLETEVERLKQAQIHKSETIENLKARLSETRITLRNLIDDSEEKMKHHQECLNSDKESFSLVSSRYEEISTQIKELDLKSTGLEQESDMMEQTISTIAESIEELQSFLESLEFKLGTSSVVMANLSRDVYSCEQRTSQHTQIHSALIAQRQAFMKDTEENLRKALKDNVKLAQEYRELQKVLLIARQQTVCVFDTRDRAEAYIQDHKQLSLLQKRMHKAMLKYFKHRSVYSQAELARFQTLSNQNNQKMKALQEDFIGSIQSLSDSLLRLTDASIRSPVPQPEPRDGPDSPSRTTPTAQTTA